MHQNLSLTEYEVLFQSLQFRLNLKLSHRLKARLMGDYCILLETRNNPVLNHSYYQQMLPHFFEYLTVESLSYQPIEVIRAFHWVLQYTSAHEDFDSASEDFESCRDTVRGVYVRLHAYLGEYAESLALLLEEDSNGHESVLDVEFENIESFLKELQDRNLPEHILKIYTDIRDRIQEENKGFEREKVWIPLVEKFEDHAGDELIVGTMYPLDVDFEARVDNHSRDIISFNNHPLNQDDLVRYQVQDAIQAARNEHGLLSRQSAKRYTVSFGFPSTEYMYSGSSFGYGMALLSLSNLEREANLRRQSLISRSFAITGGIDLNGNVRGVNTQGLREKVVAAFYSPLKGMVLPAENLTVGKAVLDELLLLHPKKVFSLIPGDRLAGILDNPRILQYEKIPLTQWAKNHLSKFRIIQSILIILVTTILLVLGSIAMQDSNLSDYKVDGERVLLFNKSGKFLWEIDLGHPTEYLEQSSTVNSRHRKVQIHDFDGDGENEVVIGTAVKQHEFNGRFYFIETDGTVKWMFSDHPVLSFGSAEYTDNYNVSFIRNYHHQGNSQDDLYVRFSHMPWFPNRLVRFDVLGNQLDEFIHPGAIYDMEIKDLNQDGEPEILLGGTNNTYNDAGIAILPSRGFGGTAPQWGNARTLDEGWVDSNLIYIKFPNWGTYDFMGTNSRSHVNDVFIDSDDGFLVTVALGGSAEVGAYMYQFDNQCNLLSLSVSDGFLGQYHQIFGEDFFTTYDRNEWSYQMSQIEIWRDGKWTRLAPQY